MIENRPVAVKVAGRIGDWIQTRSGRAYWPEDPRPGEIFAEDLAAHLAKINRYLGATRRPYSVAEHCVRVCRLVRADGGEERAQLQGLIHDGPEAYLNDIAHPVKRHLPDYRRLEALNWIAVAARFCVPVAMDWRVRYWDEAICLEERRQLLEPPPYSWTIQGSCPRLSHMGWPWWLAQWVYLRELRRLIRRLSP